MKNISFELRRQSMHVLLGLLIIFLALLDRVFTLWFLFILICFGVLLSLLQIKFNFRFIDVILDRFERQKYMRRFPFRGTLSFIFGSLLVLKIFSLDIALASIAILAFSDSFSHIIGKLGNRKNPLDKSKNIEGTISGIIVGTIAASFFVPVLFAFIASFFAMLSEVLSFKLQEEKIDDNIIIPLISATVIFLLRLFLK
ncbi:MAG: hypothetical protein KJ767_03440 [Nanoarchaeota archaeon]|nr:hypothetical protein [Nanoarchaeota archaeon]